MLDNVFTYSSIATKIRGMYAKLLTMEDYQAMIEKKSVADVATYLKATTNYGQLLSKVNVSIIHRGQLEDILLQEMMNDYKKIFYHVRGNIKIFLHLLYEKYEVESLKILFRILESKNDLALFPDSVTFLSKNQAINTSKLLSSKSSSQLIGNLRGSVYYDVLSDYETNNTFLNLFNIETSLDQYYFLQLQKQVKKLLTGNDEKVVYEALTKQLDIMNILWVYRSRKYFTMDREEMYNSMIGHQSKLSRDIIKQLVDCHDDKQFIQIVSGTKYGDIFKDENQHNYERNYQKVIYQLHVSTLRRHHFSIGSVVAYLHLKEFEIANIISVVEGIRYHIDKEEIKEFLAI
ncbi:MAG: V-type ATPase subunit [Clostridiales bacterium]|nr:V-type ATPase subunit [Clostridiales bacterium]